jgi:hypothetical protein
VETPSLQRLRNVSLAVVARDLLCPVWGAFESPLTSDESRDSRRRPRP